MSSSLKQQIFSDMKTAMKSGEKISLGVIRLMLAAIKQKEVDERIELDDTQVLAILDKMVKQRRDSIKQFDAANRKDLSDIEKVEMDIIQVYLPQALSSDEINGLINQVISQTGAESMRDMGKVIGILKPQLQGRADMGQVSALIKHRLN